MPPCLESAVSGLMAYVALATTENPYPVACGNPLKAARLCVQSLNKAAVEGQRWAFELLSELLRYGVEIEQAYVSNYARAPAPAPPSTHASATVSSGCPPSSNLLKKKKDVSNYAGAPAPAPPSTHAPATVSSGCPPSSNLLKKKKDYLHKVRTIDGTVYKKTMAKGGKHGIELRVHYAKTQEYMDKLAHDPVALAACIENQELFLLPSTKHNKKSDKDWAELYCRCGTYASRQKSSAHRKRDCRRT